MKFIRLLERSIFYMGNLVATLAFLLMCVVCVVVVLRSGFKFGAMALQELIVYIHAILFMLGVAFTLQADEHVRVDVLYRNFSARTRAWINALGCIVFLFPFCIFIFLNSLGYTLDSWQIREGSSEPGGIDAIYILKALIPIMVLSLFIQGFSHLVQQAQFLIHNKN